MRNTITMKTKTGLTVHYTANSGVVGVFGAHF